MRSIWPIAIPVSIKSFPATLQHRPAKIHIISAFADFSYSGLDQTDEKGSFAIAADGGRCDHCANQLHSNVMYHLGRDAVTIAKGDEVF
jgi:hypothetical protein